MTNLNRGFVEPKIEQENYVLGGAEVPEVTLNASGNWIQYLPKGEPQRRNIETSSCTQYATLNAIETLENFMWKKSQNYSERALAIASENSPVGNDPHKVVEVARKVGLIKEEMLPFTDALESWEDYMRPSPLTDFLLSLGKDWLNKYELKHKWVFTKGTPEEKTKKLKKALLYSPVGVSVDAWNEEGNVYVKRGNDNHWTLLVGYIGDNPLVYDSYEQGGAYIKKLEAHYDFGFAKAYFLKRNVKKNWALELLENIWDFLKWAFT
jgi:hypothetical protein